MLAINSPSSIWDNWIPRINLFFFVISALLVFGLDLYLVVAGEDSPITGEGLGAQEIFFFWVLMLVAFAIFSAFFYLEQKKYKKDFAQTSIMGLDIFILIVVLIRNVILFLNFIPVIQLLGLGAAIFGGWLVIIVYFALIFYRYRSMHTLAVRGTAY